MVQIGNEAFAGCSWLASVTIPPQSEDVCALALVVPMTRTRWEFDAFLGCIQILAKNVNVNSASTAGF